MLGLQHEDEIIAEEAVARAVHKGKKKVPSIPVIAPELEKEINEVVVPVNDVISNEPLRAWNRDNPEMKVGTVYPCMKDFRTAVKQHAIVEEFELGTEKSDKKRFRGFCYVEGCPWRIVARTQANKTVRVLLVPYVIYFFIIIYL